MTRCWLVRLGKYGEQEQHALTSGELLTGWTLDDLSQTTDKADIQAKLAHAEPDAALRTLQNWSAQLNQFVNVIDEGDLILVPLKTTGQVAIGRAVGGYYRGPAGEPARRVNWLRTDLPRDGIKQDLLYSLGAAQTICEVSRNGAAARFAAMAQTGSDPGPNVAAGSIIAADGPADAVDPLPDLAETARDQIERHVAANFAGHRFTELVAAVLRTQGYQARVSPPGADRGVDIVAGLGPLGLNGPRLVVQVKSGGVQADQPTLQSLLGSIADTHADHGLLVAWSGFTQAVRQRVNELYFRVRIWGREELLTALLANYDELPEDIRSAIPLRRVWALIPEE